MRSIHQYYCGSICLNIVILAYYLYAVSTTSKSIFVNNSTGKATTTTTPKTLIVLFTSFVDKPNKFFIHRNIIVNWATISPLIQPIFFGNLSMGSELAKLAHQHGWKVHPLSRILKGTGPPFFKDMYRLAKMLFPNSTFYGYCNGDILFTDGLVLTLNKVSQYMSHGRFNSTLVIGQRMNVAIDEKSSLMLSKRRTVIQLSRNGSLFSPIAEDYFFISKPELFPWHTIKDIVIGVPAYDNYLVAQAIRNRVCVVDATNTILAVHQTGKDGNFAGHKGKHITYNTAIIGPYNYQSGSTSLCPYITKWDVNGEIVLCERHLQHRAPKAKASTKQTTVIKSKPKK